MISNFMFNWAATLVKIKFVNEINYFRQNPFQKKKKKNWVYYLKSYNFILFLKKKRMAKSLEYPRASFKAALELAYAVDSLGGACSAELCAEKIGNKIGGAFYYIVGAAQKFGLVETKSGQINNSSLFRDIKLSYNEEEKNSNLVKAFLLPPVFLRLYDRFKGKELPVSMLEKMLIKEYSVDDNAASRIKKYFIDGAKTTNLIDDKYNLKILNLESKPETEVVETEELPTISQNSPSSEANNLISLSDLDEYVFHITGPGISSKIAIREEDDFILLEVMIRKIKKKFSF